MLTTRITSQTVAFWVILAFPALLGLAQERMIIAHRGGVVDEQRSENSLKALEEAIRRGYTHVEVDARITKDGFVVCFHNDSLLEETGIDKNLSDMSLRNVKEITLPRSQETIPTLDEYCRRCANRIHLMIDLKGCSDQWIPRYAEHIEASLKRHGLLENTLILINKTPVNNQDKLVPYFLGKAKVSWRRSLEETRAAVMANPKMGDNYYVFNHGADFTREDIQGFQALGFSVIVSINTQHYSPEHALTEGKTHVQEMIRFGADGLQIDSVYDSALLN